MRNPSLIDFIEQLKLSIGEDEAALVDRLIVTPSGTEAEVIRGQILLLNDLQVKVDHLADQMLTLPDDGPSRQAH